VQRFAACTGAERQETRSSFLKKRSKKLLDLGPSLSGYSEPGLVKVFWFFFSKKNGFFRLSCG
jgi:hypothetical protein